MSTHVIHVDPRDLRFVQLLHKQERSKRILQQGKGHPCYLAPHHHPTPSPVRLGVNAKKQKADEADVNDVKNRQQRSEGTKLRQVGDSVASKQNKKCIVGVEELARHQAVYHPAQQSRSAAPKQKHSDPTTANIMVISEDEQPEEKGNMMMKEKVPNNKKIQKSEDNQKISEKEKTHTHTAAVRPSHHSFHYYDQRNKKFLQHEVNRLQEQFEMDKKSAERQRENEAQLRHKVARGITRDRARLTNSPMRLMEVRGERVTNPDKMPHYLKHRIEEQKEEQYEREMQVYREMEQARFPPGFSPLDEGTCERMREYLKGSIEKLEKELDAIPFGLDNVSFRRRRSLLQRELSERNALLKRFSYRVVFLPSHQVKVCS